jgi:hypothetical protein
VTNRNNYEHLARIKHSLLKLYPTTIRRSVFLPHVISVDHSVNRWLYERWLKTYSVEIELKSLHREMAQRIIDQLDAPGIEIAFVHLDPRTTKHARASY